MGIGEVQLVSRERLGVAHGDHSEEGGCHSSGGLPIVACTGVGSRRQPRLSPCAFHHTRAVPVRCIWGATQSFPTQPVLQRTHLHAPCKHLHLGARRATLHTLADATPMNCVAAALAQGSAPSSGRLATRTPQQQPRHAALTFKRAAAVGSAAALGASPAAAAAPLPQRSNSLACRAVAAPDRPATQAPSSGSGSPPLKVIIAGGGIGGLVLAVGLLKRRFDVTVLERDMTAIRGEGKYRGPIQVRCTGGMLRCGAARGLRRPAGASGGERGGRGW